MCGIEGEGIYGAAGTGDAEAAADGAGAEGAEASAEEEGVAAAAVSGEGGGPFSRMALKNCSATPHI
jgi:hypothetical protein